MYSADGVAVFTVAWEDSSYGSIDVAECAEWADYFGLSFPVLADTTQAVYSEYKLTDNGRPLYVLIDRSMYVQYRGTGSRGHSDAESLIPDFL